MKLWWAADIRRFSRELTAVEAAVAEGWFHLSRWYLDEGQLVAAGEIVAHGAQYSVRLVYPDQFPLVPAWVEPQDPDALWSQHQYGRGGSLCLELRPDNWQPMATGGDVLRSAHNLLRAENPLGDGPHERVASAHHVGGIQAYDIEANPVLIGHGCLQRILDGTATDLHALRWFLADDVWPIMVYDEVDIDSDGRPPSPDVFAGTQEIAVRVAHAYCGEPDPTCRRALSDRLGLNLSDDEVPGPLVVLAVDNGNIASYHSTDAASVYVRKVVELPDDFGTRSGDAIAISAKQIAIVGAGSVGSKIAETLMRSGAKHLVLVDGDVMLPGNLERHTLDWRDVGFRKVHAVRRRLLNIRPNADVLVYAQNLNWQRSSRTQSFLISKLAECEIIIDATGDVPTSLYLGALATDNAKPFISVEVLEGGIGCVIARSLPGHDDTYAAGRAAFLAFCEQRSVEPPRSGGRPYEALTGEGTSVVADDGAVSVAAGHAARIAIDVLRETIDKTSAAWLLIGLGRAWVFQGHAETIGIHVPIAPDASAVDSPPESDEEQRARAFALSILVEATGEAPHSE